MSRPIRNDGKDDVDLPDDIINILSKKCLPWLNKTNVFLNRFPITDWISRRKALIIVYTLMEYQYFSYSKTWCPARNQRTFNILVREFWMTKWDRAKQYNTFLLLNTNYLFERKTFLKFCFTLKLIVKVFALWVKFTSR